MIFFDRVGHEGNPDLIELSMPALSRIIRAEEKGLIHFCVGEGFVLAFIPSETAGDAEIRSEILLDIEAKAILQRVVFFYRSDFRRRRQRHPDNDSQLRGSRPCGRYCHRQASEGRRRDQAEIPSNF